MNEGEGSKLIDALKKLIQGEEKLVRQMRRTIAVVDKKLHHEEEAKKDPFLESDRDIA